MLPVHQMGAVGGKQKPKSEAQAREGSILAPGSTGPGFPKPWEWSPGTAYCKLGSETEEFLLLLCDNIVAC